MYRIYCLKTRKDETTLGCIINGIEVTQDRVCQQVFVNTVITWVSWTVLGIFLTSCVLIFSSTGISFHEVNWLEFIVTAA